MRSGLGSRPDVQICGPSVSRTGGAGDATYLWDVASALVATTGVGGNRVYAYDASGQRVAQVRVDRFGLGAVALDATVYVDSVEARDEQPLTPGGVSAQRFVSFGGATVAVESTGDAGGSVWSLILGDVQGSAQVMVDLVVSGTATGWALFDGVSHGVSRAAHTPFGASRGDGLDVSRGWLGQVEDAGTGLTYLNARYYDPATMRFISPDPLMNPGDPRTLDPYRYANNNPVAFTDASGLTAACSGLSGANEAACLKAFNKGWSQKAPGRVVNKPGTGKFWGDAAKGYAGTMWSTAAQATPYGTYKSLELLFTDPKGFGQQYVDGANWAKGYGEDWLHQVGVAGDILQGDRSVWEYGTELCHSKMMLNLCDSWDSGDGKAFGSKVAIGVQTIGGLAMGGGGGAARTAGGEATLTRFTVNSSGETTLHLSLGSSSVAVSEHAALRMAERSVSIGQAEAALTQTPFKYFHDGTWKTGYYDTTSRVFVGTVNSEVTTVISGASPKYISNLQAVAP